MNRIRFITLTLIFDFIAQILVWYSFYFIKFRLDWLGSETTVEPAVILLPAVILAFFWIALFAVFGLYKRLFLISRFDEILRVGKITLIGSLILHFILFIDQLNWDAENISQAKFYVMYYWLLVFVFTSFFRLLIRTFQKKMTLKGVGLLRAIIVGNGRNAVDVAENLDRNRVLGLDVIGFVKVSDILYYNAELTKPILGYVRQIKEIVLKNEVADVIVALESDESQELIQIIDQLDIPNVSVKILPDFYQMIIGLNRTNQIFGLPLIDVLPDPMPSWEKMTKRFLDIITALILLVLTSPILLLLSIIIPLSSEGKPIYKQQRVGLFGKLFTIYKFRTMVNDAEKDSGPRLATQNDARITPLGLFLRKARLDELPQLWNVLKGDMSLVGPRPERPFFVEQFKKQIPLYSRRLRVRPGITGWAQVKWKYDESFDDVVEKTKYDLFYVENMSLRMDFKILINTISTVVTGKGQ